MWWQNLDQAIKDGENDKIMTMLNEVSVVEAKDDTGRNLLHYFTQSDNEIIITQLIAAGCDVNSKNRYGETPLMSAIESNNLKVAKILLDTGAMHLNTNFNEDFGPLHIAVWYGYADMIKILLESGADVNVVDEEYSSPLHLAAKTEGEENLDIVKMLLAAGADVNCVDYQGFTPLHCAVRWSNYTIANLLLDAGTAADVMDLNFETPLHWSVRDSNMTFSSRLISAGADVDMVNCHGMTCLHYAVQNCHLQMVSMLLAAGATPNCTDEQGYSPLHWAVRNNDVVFVRNLLQAGADVNIQDDEDAEGLLALQVAAELGLIDIINLLLSHGADVKGKCNRGYNVLYYAAMSKRIGVDIDDDLYVDILKLLLDQGAEIGEDNYNIKTPFNSVLLYGNERAVRLFIEQGVDLTKCLLTKSKISSLHHAALNNDKGVLQFLVESGHFNIEEKCGSGLTPLHLAALSNNVNCIKYLLKKGANINNDNMYGATPLYSGIINGHVESVWLLLDKGADINFKTTRNESILGVAVETDVSAILQYVIREIAKVEAMDEYVNPDNFELIRKYEDLQYLYETCIAELTLMQECYIDGKVSFFHILTRPDIGSYARNENIINTFEKQNVTEYFPIYADLLTRRFSKELKRQILMKKAMTGLSRILRCEADTFYMVFYKIMNYVNKEDLKTLIEV